MAFRPVTIRPSDGGQLVSAASSEAASARHYITKRDWRRVDEREVVSEGYHTHLSGLDEEVNLVVQCTQGNGAKATVIGTPTKLYRHWESELKFVEDGFVEDGFVESVEGVSEIGSFQSGSRWEAV